MSRKYNLALPIGILSITTFAIGGIVYGLLWNEAKRIQTIGNATSIEQARTVAENIALTVADTKSALIESVAEFRGPDFGPQLDNWQSYEPLAAFTFVWSADIPNSLELFSQGRFDPIDLKNENGYWMWDSPVELEESFGDKDIAEIPAQNYAENREVRQNIRSQSKLSSQRALKKFEPQRLWSNDASDWVQTSIRGKSIWLGIVRWNNSAKITGVGFDPSSLSEAFASTLPANKRSENSIFVLLDPDGIDAINASSYMGQSSFNPEDRIKASDTVIPIGPELPGWNLLVSHSQLDTIANTLSSTGGIAAAGILACLLGSGLWLAWQSRASQEDAAKKVSFVSNVSHELKTPLTTIRMYSELLNSDRVKDSEKRNKYLNTISSESQRLTRMVNNVLDFSRLEKGKTTLKPINQPLAPRLREYIELRREEITRKKFELHEEIENTETPYLFDADALNQIIGNLIDNSLKYANTGKFISISLSDHPDHARITVADRGPGLPKSLRKKRFNAFEQGDTSLVADKRGFGLGLSIAQSLANEMGAQLAYRHPQKSTDQPRFILTIPHAG